ncbi:MAG: 50S ribosomal protein L13 [Patescibacteria group bacterium]
MITIDAKNKILGRLASEISQFLIGKHKADYVPYKNAGEAVEVVNIDELGVSGNKMDQKIYYKHTGYVGHLNKKRMKEFPKAELLKKAVWNMLPKNRLRKERFKMLKIK